MEPTHADALIRAARSELTVDSELMARQAAAFRESIACGNYCGARTNKTGVNKQGNLPNDNGAANIVGEGAKRFGRFYIGKLRLE